jgi:hypothetical protein
MSFIREMEGEVDNRVAAPAETNTQLAPGEKVHAAAIRLILFLVAGAVALVSLIPD